MPPKTIMIVYVNKFKSKGIIVPKLVQGLGKKYVIIRDKYLLKRRFPMKLYESRHGKNRVTACITNLKKGRYYEVHLENGNVLYIKQEIFNRMYVRTET